MFCSRFFKISFDTELSPPTILIFLTFFNAFKWFSFNLFPSVKIIGEFSRIESGPAESASGKSNPLVKIAEFKSELSAIFKEVSNLFAPEILFIFELIFLRDSKTSFLIVDSPPTRYTFFAFLTRFIVASSIFSSIKIIGLPSFVKYDAESASGNSFPDAKIMLSKSFIYEATFREVL